MFLEYLAAFIKTLPHWLAMLSQAIIVMVLTSFAIIFLFGLWTGIRVIGYKAGKIRRISLMPFEIEFEPRVNTVVTTAEGTSGQTNG